MDMEHRDKIREAARRRGNCPKCNNSTIETVDGKEVGGLPGIQYKRCNACGWTRAITKRQRRGL